MPSFDAPFRCRVVAVAALVLALASANSLAQREPPPAPATAEVALPSGVTRVGTIEGIHEYRLGNGLQVLLLPEPSAPKLTLNIVYRVGSRHESYGETGMAHLLEHLLFKGSPRFPDMPLEFKRHGATVNGTTSLDRTNYFATFPANDENLARMLDLEADRMVNAFIARKDLDSEMTVVRNELEIGESQPIRLLFQALDAAIFRWHNYGRSTIGNRSDLENVGIDRLRDFYRRHYRPDNATLIIAGKLDQAATLALVARRFGPIARPDRPLEPEYTVEPTQDGERSVTVRRTGDSQMVAVAYRASAAAHPDHAPLRILAHVLGASPNGRLHKRLVEAGKATSTSVSLYAGFDPGRIAAYASLRKEDSIEAVRETLIAALEGLVAEPATEAEVARAKAAFAAAFESRRANMHGVATSLTSAIAAGDWRLHFWDRDELAKVTVADVQRVAAHYLKRDNRTVATFLPTEKPERAEIPARRDPKAFLEGYRGGASASEGEDFDPSQAAIDARTQTVTLDGGAKLALLQKRTTGDRIRGQLTLRFGNQQSLTGWGAAPSTLGVLLSRGTRRLDRGAFSDELVRLKAELSISAGGGSATATFATTRDNVEALLRLVVEALREPALPGAELELARRSRLQAIDGVLKNPQSLAGSRLGELFNAYPKEHPFYSGTPAEQRVEVETVTLDRVRQFHTSHYGADAATLALVGSFEPEMVKRLADELLNGWRSATPYRRVPTVAAEVKAVSETLDVPDQSNATLLARHTFRMRDSDPDYPALLVASNIFGGGGLTSRLTNRLRQKDGLSYGTGSSLSVGTLNTNGAFSIYASFATAAAPRLEAAVCEELERAHAQGFTDAEVAIARDHLLSQRRLNRTNDAALVSTLASNLYLGRTMAWSAEFEDRVRALTAAEVSAAFRRHVQPDRLVVVKAGSFGPTPVPAATAERRLPACGAK